MIGFWPGLPSEDPRGAMPGATFPLLGWTDQLTLSEKAPRSSELRCSVAYAEAVLEVYAGCCGSPKSPRLSWPNRLVVPRSGELPIELAAPRGVSPSDARLASCSEKTLRSNSGGCTSHVFGRCCRWEGSGRGCRYDMEERSWRTSAVTGKGSDGKEEAADAPECAEAAAGVAAAAIGGGVEVEAGWSVDVDADAGQGKWSSLISKLKNLSAISSDV